MLISNKLESIDSLSKSEEVLANYILGEKENIEKLSTKDLANATYTSPSTVVRLSQKLGFSGWNEFKEKYLEELQYLNRHYTNVDPNAPFEAQDSYLNIASKVANLASDSIGDCTFSITTREKLYSKIGTYFSNDSIHLILDILYSCLFKNNYDYNLEYKTNISRDTDKRFSDSYLLKE